MIDKILLKGFLDEINWSYSNIKTFCTCKKEWYRNYILGEDGEGSFYADYGLLAHKMLEEYGLGKIQLFDMKSFIEYNWNIDIKSEPPHIKSQDDILETYYSQLIDFAESFEGFDDETVGVESKIDFTIMGRNFVGFIDRLSKSDDGEYIITDYKSKAKFNGRKELEEYTRQLYLYSTYVKEKYGKFPKQLKFLLFRTNKEVVVEFDENKYNETIKYICDVIDSIYNESNFSCNYSYFYCKHLCRYRYDCTFE